MSAARVFKFNEPGSRVLREFNEKLARDRLIAQRGRANMGRAWFDGVTGINNGGFAGAGINRLTSTLAQWSGSINADLDGNISILRARARQLCQNNEFGRRFLGLLAGNVIGKTGPTLQLRALDPKGQLDTAANSVIETAYAQWTRRCDVRGLLSLAQIQQISIKGAARDGEALIRLVRGREQPNGLGLQLLEADRLDDQLNRTLTSGNIIRQGVECDSLLRPVAYWIKSSHPGDTMANHIHGAGTDRVPADQILHIYLPERAEQVRGYTWFHAVLLRMQMLHAYQEAAVVAARVGAAKMGVFTRKDGANGALAQMAEGTGPTGIPQLSAEAGEFFELPEGYSLESWDPEYPHANFDSFLKACFGGVATGLDVATHNLTGDMTQVNYSSARIAELSERDHWELLQEWWINTVSQVIFRNWLESALIRGEIRFPQSGKALPADKLQKFTEAARFQGRRWQWVDPVKDIEAAEREVALGIRSRTEIAASRGREFEDVVAELQQENATLTAAGLPTTVGKPAAGAPAAEPEDGAADGAKDDTEDGKKPTADKTLMLALAQRLMQPEQQPVINIDARSTHHNAAPEINLEAHMPAAEPPKVEVHNEVRSEAPIINVNPTPVEIQNNVDVTAVSGEVKLELPARKTVSDLEYSAGGDIKRVTQLETDA